MSVLEFFFRFVADYKIKPVIIFCVVMCSPTMTLRLTVYQSLLIILLFSKESLFMVPDQ